jgi:hypothetical protein
MGISWDVTIKSNNGRDFFGYNKNMKGYIWNILELE